MPLNKLIDERSFGFRTVIDLTDLPLELTQKMELQLLKNSNEARILMFVTITGLSTAVRSPLQASDTFSTNSPLSSPISMSRSFTSLSNFDTRSDLKDSISERDEKSSYPVLPVDYLQLVAEHFVSPQHLVTPIFV